MEGHVTIVGGGLGGLTAAIAAREAGWEATVLEAAALGGRARTMARPYRANWGPHVIYSDGPLWAWLDERDLTRPYRRVPWLSRPSFRVDSTRCTVPPLRAVRAMLRLLSPKHEAPVERSFMEWAASVVGDREAAQVSSFMGVATFDHDPGRLSAAFVHERLRRATTVPPTVRYIEGGWFSLAGRLAAHARRLGAVVEINAKVDRLPEAPVVLAVPLAAARRLLDDDTVAWTGTRTVLLDVAMRRRRRDPFFVSDFDESGWAETYSQADTTLAPRGEQLVQAQKGLRPGEDLDHGVARVEQLLDAGYPGWRERETWRRRARVTDESGALDLPGTTWRDRPAIDRGDGVYLVGDMVAAPGLLSEVTHHAALATVSALTTVTGSRQGYSPLR